MNPVQGQGMHLVRRSPTAGVSRKPHIKLLLQACPISGFTLHRIMSTRSPEAFKHGMVAAWKKAKGQ